MSFFRIFVVRGVSFKLREVRVEAKEVIFNVRDKSGLTRDGVTPGSTATSGTTPRRSGANWYKLRLRRRDRLARNPKKLVSFQDGSLRTVFIRLTLGSS